jgi:putative phosphoesterase
MLPHQLESVFCGVDLILHAGDIHASSVLDDLEKIAPVLAALGDGDYLPRDERVKYKHVLGIDGLTLWLTHEFPFDWRFASGSYDDVSDRELAESLKLYGSDAPDIAVFGHSHQSIIRHGGGALLINPGSATFPRYERCLGTVCLVNIRSGRAEVQLVQLEGTDCPYSSQTYFPD